MLNELYSNFGGVLIFIGLLLTVWEAIKPFKGLKYNDERDPMKYGLDPSIDGAPRTETNEFIKWKTIKRYLIISGVLITAIGIILQISY